MRLFISALRSNRIAVGAALLLVVFFFFICRPFGLYFLCDDFAAIPQTTVGAWFQTRLLRPLLHVSLWMDFRLWGVNAVGYHGTNLVFHLINAVLIFLVAHELLKKFAPAVKNRFFSCSLVALFFLCYAFHSEPLFWIVGRVGSLCTLFIQASLLFYLKERLVYRIASLSCFILGLLTYELSWILPVLITAFWIYQSAYLKKRNGILPVLFYWAILFIYLFVRATVLNKNAAGYDAGSVLSGRVFQLTHNYMALVARVFVPPAATSGVFVGWALLAVCLLVALFVFTYKKWSVHFALAMLLLVCLLISLLPVVSLGIDTHDTESERYIYPASVFFCILLVVLLNGCFTRRFVFVFMILLCSLHLALLYKASVAYRYASYVSRFTIESLNRAPSAKKIILQNLPTQYRGALIFRIGFPRSSPGIMKETYDTVVIDSFKELIERKKFVRMTSGLNNTKQELYVEFAGDTLKLHP